MIGVTLIRVGLAWTRKAWEFRHILKEQQGTRQFISLGEYGYIRENEVERSLRRWLRIMTSIKHHGIDTRYWYADENLQIEEAIAEEFRTWEKKA